jgi:hypothetical protein
VYIFYYNSEIEFAFYPIPAFSLFFISFACPKETKQRKKAPKPSKPECWTLELTLFASSAKPNANFSLNPAIWLLR